MQSLIQSIDRDGRFLTPEVATAKNRCERSHLDFTRYHFKKRQNAKFQVNWHHYLIAQALEKVISGEIENLVINVPPGSSKTEMAMINFMARGLALNPWCRFLHLSYSDELALLNSQTTRDLVESEEFQEMWPLQLANDAKAKGRWNVLVDGKKAGGVYATSLNGQITGFRAGHMRPGFMGAILIDDPLKPEDAFSKPKLAAANRRLITTVKSRKANPKTPIVIIMQRIAEGDPCGFIQGGNIPGEWHYLKVPALMDEESFNMLPEAIKFLVDKGPTTTKGRFSYWPEKELLSELLTMERGDGADQSGSRISRHVFGAQYQQNPVALGGNIIRGEHFERYTVLPQLAYRQIFADTAQKTAERNDFSVFECWGKGRNGKIYLLDMIRGKWEAPELKRRAIAFWHKHNQLDVDQYGTLRNMVVEDKSSGTGLIQDIGSNKLDPIPIEPIERTRDKLTRVMDVVAYIEAHIVCIPADAPFTNDFVAECEAFTADDTHAFDDQIDPLIDAIVDMLSTGNKMNVWERLGEGVNS
jgi:predicted phage terminase large subunit-like protein